MKPPAGNGHLFDDQVLAGVGGAVEIDEGLVKGQEFLAAFDGETDAVGEAAWGGEAVTGGVGGGTRFAFGRNRPLGFFCRCDGRRGVGLGLT